MREDISQAISLIKLGEVVAFPTETVYGLGADATNEEACKKIFTIKGRPSINPLIIHVASIQMAKKFAIFNDKAEKLASLWPGPLTMVLPIKQGAKIAKSVVAGLNTVAIRIPSHPVILELLQGINGPIAAPSANISGYVSSTKYAHVVNDFGNSIFMLNDDSKKTYGLESTIIDLSTTIPTILRSGVITIQDIEQILLEKITVSKEYAAIKAPGMLDKHYSPHTQVILNVAQSNNNSVAINFSDSKLPTDLNLSNNGDLLEAASNLYEMLREADLIAQKNNLSYIEIAPIPHHGLGIAINDRLKRAAVR